VGVILPSPERHPIRIAGLCLLGSAQSRQPSTDPATTCDSYYKDSGRACAYYTFGCSNTTAAMAAAPTCWSGALQSPVHLTRAGAVLADPDPGQLTFMGYSTQLTSLVLRAEGYNLQMDLISTPPPTMPTTTTSEYFQSDVMQSIANNSMHRPSCQAGGYCHPLHLRHHSPGVRQVIKR
jgi:hypothetical protein